MEEKVTVNGREYVAVRPPSARAVVVVDRGWIFAGDVSEENGRIKLTRALWIFRWESIGFDGVIADPRSAKVTIKPVSDVDLPAGSEVFRIPVCPNWGL